MYSWEDDIVGLVEKKHGNRKFSLSFECETLKADKAAEEHISKYMPNLKGLDAVGKHIPVSFVVWGVRKRDSFPSINSISFFVLTEVLGFSH